MNERAPNIYINLQTARDAIEDLNKDQIAEIFLGILDYFEGKPLNLDSDIIVKKSIKPLLRDIDYNNEKYKAKCNSQREKALKRWGKKTDEDMPNYATESHGINGIAENANNKDKDKYNNKYKNNNKDKSLFEADEAEDSSQTTLNDIAKKFNALIVANKSAIKQIKTLKAGTQRARSTIARVKEFGLEKFIQGLDNATKSQFLSDSTWASFDWIILPNNFPKVLEGNYNKEQQNGNSNRYPPARASELQSRIDFGGAKSAADYEL